MTDLGRRAVACKAWRWMRGMTGVDAHGTRFIVTGYAAEHGDKLLARAVDDGDAEGFAFVEDDDVSRDWYDDPTPDMTDPATLGCVLAILRDVYRDPCLHLGWFSTLDGERWCVMTIAVGGGPAFTATSEAEALVLALEAAPVLS